MKELRIKSYYFRIAGHVMEVQLWDKLKLSSCLPGFEAFRVKGEGKRIVSRVKVIRKNAPGVEDIASLAQDFKSIYDVGYGIEDSLRSVLSVSLGQNQLAESWELYSIDSFRYSVIYVGEETALEGSILSWLLMLVFGHSTLRYKTLLLDASVVDLEGLGYAFLGSKDNLKSIHSSLWVSCYEDTSLLSEGYPVVRVMPGGTVMIYGSPWSIVSCYKNRGVELKGLVCLYPGNENRWREVIEREAFISVFPGCMFVQWHSGYSALVRKNLKKVISRVRVGHLSCLPEVSAVRDCRLGLESI
ncbi:hypothetical protein [Elizabethkingia anophelis]|uniref:Uncharacterized protein n=1 Tax=Elizabethkingia anophelis TaxID=1117645 RepID=A0AAU8V1S6_9FLAO|nr:hypothetical protein [Elizabethkingia anophelis]AQX02254.1 hypothetical protein BBD32_12695 [Elizabethkingia anophelis]OPB63774.1 hypothetical protein BAY11_16865 [Elizabethkingia anophelis]